MSLWKWCVWCSHFHTIPSCLEFLTFKLALQLKETMTKNENANKYDDGEEGNVMCHLDKDNVPKACAHSAVTPSWLPYPPQVRSHLPIPPPASSCHSFPLPALQSVIHCNMHPTCLRSIVQSVKAGTGPPRLGTMAAAIIDLKEDS